LLFFPPALYSAGLRGLGNSLMRRNLSGLTLVLAWLLVSTQAPAAVAPEVKAIDPPKNILFIGNSFTYYNNGLHNYLRQLIDAADSSGEASGVLRLMTISGAKLAEHAPALRAILQSEEWDAVVLQGHSLEAVDRSTLKNFRDAVRAFHKEIKKSGADTVLFMTWAYSNQPRMTDSLDTSYTILGNFLDSLVVPVGRAFERARQQHPDIALIMEDRKHPTLAGTYLAACVFYSALYGQSPAELDDGPPGLTAQAARALREVAWAAVRAYYDKQADM